MLSYGAMKTRVSRAGIRTIIVLILLVCAAIAQWETTGTMNLRALWKGRRRWSKVPPKAGSCLMIECAPPEFDLLVGSEHQDHATWRSGDVPRVITFAGERYMALLGLTDSAIGVIGLVDQSGFNHLHQAVTVEGRISSIYVAPKNWVVTA